MAQRIEALHAAKPISTSVDCPQHITEGIYIIRNSVSRKVLQLDAGIQSTEWVHVYTAPQCDQSGDGGEVDLSQLWSITALPNSKAKYVIRSLAAGTCLDLKWESREPGAHVGCYPFQGSVNETWQFYSSRDDTYVHILQHRNNCATRLILESLYLGPTSVLFEIVPKRRRWIPSALPNSIVDAYTAIPSMLALKRRNGPLYIRPFNPPSSRRLL